MHSNLIRICQREVAERSGYDIVWLKGLADELVADNTGIYLHS